MTTSRAIDLVECPHCQGRGWRYYGTEGYRERCPDCQGKGMIPDNAVWPVFLTLALFLVFALVGYRAGHP